MERRDLGSVSNEEPLLQSGAHVYWVMGEDSVGGEEWGNAFDGTAFAPSSGFPQIFASGVMEEIVCPLSFGLGDDIAKCADS